jgi:hypothetical protein
MMENGPVIQAGHTMGYDENVAYRFHEAPEGLELPYPTKGILLVTREGGKKRKKLFGVF